MKQSLRQLACRLFSISPASTPRTPTAALTTTFAPLEPRLLLSGDVTATIDGGNLVVHGDRAANVISLDQAGLSAGQVRITGTSGTTINGKSASLVLSNATRGVVIEMGDGADRVTAADLNISRDFSVTDSEGANVLSLTGITLGGNLSIHNLLGQSSTTISGANVGKNLKIAGESGGQKIVLRSNQVAKNTRLLSGGKGAASVTIDNSRLRGSLEIRTGNGKDLVTIDTHGALGSRPTTVGHEANINLNGGRDILQLGQAGQTRNRPTFGSTGRFDGGDGRDTLENNDAAASTDKERFAFISFEAGADTLTDTTAPTVTLTDPATGAIGVARNKKIAVTFSEAMNPSTIASSNVAVSRGKIAVAGTIAYTGRTMTFTPSTRLAASKTYTVTVTTGAQDLAGNSLAHSFTFAFTTGASSDSTAPTVSVVDPSNAAAGVALNKQIAASFSEAMDPLTITASTVSVKAGSTSVAGTVAYVGTTMTFTPAAALAANTTYTGKISTGAKDLAGNALAADYSWTFTTGSTADTIAPTVTLISPIAGKTNVVLNKKVAATFSESIDPLTVTATTYTLTGPGNTTVTGTVSYDAATKTATFTPLSNLAVNTLYTAKILGGTAGAKDLAGNPLAADKVWSFTTGTVIAQPMIVLGRAGPFAIMATSAVSGTGPNDVVGNVGLTPGSSQGIPPSEIDGDVHVNDTTATNAQLDLRAAYDDAISRSTTPAVLPGNMGGLTFTPGLYVNSTSVQIQGAGAANNVTLDAQGDADAVFIFKMGTTLTTGPGAHVILTGGAKASNIFWQVGSSATLNTTTIFKGNVLAAVSITVNAGSDVEGRLFGGSNTDGSVTVNASTVKIPTL